MTIMNGFGSNYSIICDSSNETVSNLNDFFNLAAIALDNECL